MKKRVLALLLGTVLTAGAFAGCSSTATEQTTQEDTQSSAQTQTEEVTLKVGAVPTPHAEILESVKDTLAAEGIGLEIVEFSDYIQPNIALASGELDANFFQHEPYLINSNEENGTDLVSIGTVHYEPMCIYAGKTASLTDVPQGAKVAVPNDPTNEARALLLLEANGLLTINADAGINATKLDILENPYNLDIVEVEAAQVPRSLQDVDLAVVNGNYAVGAGFDISQALAKEASDSVSAQTYANVVAVRAEDAQRPELLKLMEALKSDEVKNFIEANYQGAVEPIE